MAIINNGSGFIYVDADPNTDLTPNTGEDSEVAWDPSATNLYFWNRGNSEWDLFAPGGTTIYNGNSTVIADREVELDGNSLAFLGGDVGIRVATPDANLHIVGSGNTTGKSFFVENSDGDDNFTILDNGNVGIGTASPTTTLDVTGTIKGTNFEQGGSTDNLFVGYSEFENGISMVSTKIENLADPTAAQDAATKAYVDANSGSGGKFIDGTDTLDAVYNDGNVGVGTNTPTQELHVVGGVRVTGAIYDSNNEAGTSGQVLSSTVTGTDWVDMPLSTASLTNHYLRASLTSAFLTGGASQIDFDLNSDNTLIGLSQDESVGSDITFASNTFTVSGNGLYTVTISAEFKSDDTQRACPTVSILVNGSVVDGKSLAYVRNSNAAEEATVNLTRTLNLTDADTVSVRWRNQGVTGSDVVTSEQFMVEVFKHAFTVTGALGSSGKFIDGTNTADAVYNAGNVGIGTSDPTQDLHVVGNARITGAIYDSNNETGTSGQVLSSTGTGTDWIDGGGDSIYTADGTLAGDREVTFNGSSLTYTTTNGTFEHYSDNVFVYNRSVTGNDTTVRYSDTIVLLHEDTSGSKNIDTVLYVESGSPRFTQTQDTSSAGFYVTSTTSAAMQVDTATDSTSIELSDTAMTVTDAATIYTGEAEYALSTSEPSLGLSTYNNIALIRFTGANSSTIHGMSSGVTGRQLAFTNNTSGTITFKSLSGTASNSAHRFYMNADVTVASGGAGIFHYSGEKWRILSAVG
ncbi:MAG: hypothetical protein P8P29_08125 [Flavobacteriaceae bacterium]|nr:hypothetical protein [Flavobacteriaceae bacterium]